MPKSSQVQLAQRINTAFDLLGKGSAKEEVVAVLIRRYQVSTRQAHRYIEQAQQTKRKLPIPEQKVAYCVHGITVPCRRVKSRVVPVFIGLQRSGMCYFA